MKEKIFCAYCGKENKPEKKMCKKCLQPLNPKDHLLIDYFRKKWFGNAKDGIFSAIKTFLRTHLYGFIMTCSILIATVSAIVSITNTQNKFEIVTEKPTIKQAQYEYGGAGLSKEELAKQYVAAIKNNDIKSAKSLQLKEFHKDIYDELMRGAATYQDKIATSFELLEHKDIYCKDMKEKYYVGKSDYAQSIKTFGNYQTDNYIAFLPYCSYNHCPISDVEEHDVEIAIEIQIIEIAGNNYILGEKVSERLNLFEAIAHRSLFLAHGDTSKFDFNAKFDLFDSCISETGISVPYTSEKYDENCLKKIGYFNIPVQGW